MNKLTRLQKVREANRLPFTNRIMSRGVLGAAVCITGRSIANYEHGLRCRSAATRSEIAYVLGVSERSLWNKGGFAK